MTAFQGIRSKWGLALPVFIVLAFSAGGADGQLKDCFDVYEEARQSRLTALQDCCRGTFDRKKKHSMGWVWHNELNLYVDESKCDRAELRKILIEKLKKDEPASKESEKPPGGSEKPVKTSKRSIDVGTRIEYKRGKIIQKGGNFRGANLAGLVYTYGNADKANFEGADLRNANFEGTNLAGANFRNARLEGANFNFSYLKGAVFTNASLAGASLKGAVLRGANFIGARVTVAQLSVAVWVGAILDAILEKGLKDFEKGTDAFWGKKK